MDRTAEKKSIGFFEKYLTAWVLLCIISGVIIGKLFGSGIQSLSNLTLYQVNMPVAVLIWLMIYPMMLKVDFASIVNVGKNPKGLVITWVVNWLIKPFSMFGIAEAGKNTETATIQFPCACFADPRRRPRNQHRPLCLVRFHSHQ